MITPDFIFLATDELRHRRYAEERPSVYCPQSTVEVKNDLQGVLQRCNAPVSKNWSFTTR
jgi:hypothetical protein